MYYLPIEGQMMDKAGNLISGSHNLTVTIRNSTGDFILNYTYINIALDTNSRYFEYINTTYGFADNVTITTRIDNDAFPTPSLIGEVPVAISARKLYVDENVNLGRFNMTADTFKGNWNSSINYVPYMGATSNTDLGDKNLTTNGTINATVYYINGNNSYLFYNASVGYLQLIVNGKLQQEWGNSTHIYGRATFYDEARFTTNFSLNGETYSNLTSQGTSTSYNDSRINDTLNSINTDNDKIRQNVSEHSNSIRGDVDAVRQNITLVNASLDSYINTQISLHDECSEINGCVPNALVSEWCPNGLCRGSLTVTNLTILGGYFNSTVENNYLNGSFHYTIDNLFDLFDYSIRPLTSYFHYIVADNLYNITQVDALFNNLLVLADSRYASHDDVVYNKTASDNDISQNLTLSQTLMTNNATAIGNTILGNRTYIDNNVSTINSDVTNNVSNIRTTITGNLTLAQTLITNNATALGNNIIGNLTYIDNNISTVNSDITNNASNIRTTITGNLTLAQLLITNNATNLQNNLTTVVNNITQINGNLTDIFNNVTMINGNLTDLFNNVTNIHTTITNNISTINTDITNNVSNVRTTITSNLTLVQLLITNNISDSNNKHDTMNFSAYKPYYINTSNMTINFISNLTSSAYCAAGYKAENISIDYLGIHANCTVDLNSGGSYSDAWINSTYGWINASVVNQTILNNIVLWLSNNVSQDWTWDSNNLTATNNNINNNITNLNTDVTNNATSANTNISAIKVNLTDIYLNLTDVNTNISSIKGNLTGIMSNITNIQYNLTDIYLNISDGNSNITTLKYNMTIAFQNISNALAKSNCSGDVSCPNIMYYSNESSLNVSEALYWHGYNNPTNLSMSLFLDDIGFFRSISNFTKSLNNNYYCVYNSSGTNLACNVSMPPNATDCKTLQGKAASEFGGGSYSDGWINTTYNWVNASAGNQSIWNNAGANWDIQNNITLLNTSLMGRFMNITSYNSTEFYWNGNQINQNKSWLYNINFSNATNCDTLDGKHATEFAGGLSIQNVVDNIGNLSASYFIQQTTKIFNNTYATRVQLAVMNFSVAANTNYTLDCVLYVGANETTTGVQFNLTVPPQAIWFEARYAHPTTTSAVTFATCRNGTGVNAGWCGDPSTTSIAWLATANVLPVELSASLQNGAYAGGMNLTFASEVLGHSAYVDWGSKCEFKKMGSPAIAQGMAMR